MPVHRLLCIRASAATRETWHRDHHDDRHGAPGVRIDERRRRTLHDLEERDKDSLY